MVTAVMAQPAEPIVSVAELPSGSPAHAPSCWLIAGIVIELSAAATTGAPSPAASAIANTRTRRLAVGLGSLTDRKFRPDKHGPSWGQACAQTNRGTDQTSPRLAGPKCVSRAAGEKPMQPSLRRYRCYGFWTLSPGRYSGLVKK